jgi:hypothetical protein
MKRRRLRRAVFWFVFKEERTCGYVTVVCLEGEKGIIDV